MARRTVMNILAALSTRFIQGLGFWARKIGLESHGALSLSLDGSVCLNLNLTGFLPSSFLT